MTRHILIAAVLTAILPVMGAPGATLPAGVLRTSERSREVERRVAPEVRTALTRNRFIAGSAMFIRIFKEERELEVWMLRGGRYALALSRPIAAMSGTLGPKLREGDRQAPEGFYALIPGAMNPSSAFHLSCDIGFPNAYDRLHGRSGSLIMIHGGNTSIGCFAMTDPVIETLWVLWVDAFRAGHASIPVHIFPFRMTEENMSRHADHPSLPFWRLCKTAYDAFEADGLPPDVVVENRTYRIIRPAARTEKERP